jgi:hypothetical protein
MICRTFRKCSFKTDRNICVRILFNGGISTKQLYNAEFDEINISKARNKLSETKRKFLAQVFFLRLRRKWENNNKVHLRKIDFDGSREMGLA